MKEATKCEIAKCVIALMSLQTAYNRGWKITPQTSEAIQLVIDDLKFYYQFAKND